VSARRPLRHVRAQGADAPAAGQSVPSGTGAAAPAPLRRRRPWEGVELETVFAPLAMVALFIALSAASDEFLTRGNLINVATQMAVLAIVSFGVTVVMVSGAFDLSVGSQLALHGCVAAIVMRDTGSIPLGILAGLASGAVFGLVNGLLTTHLAINPFVVTLGTLVIGRGIALAITDARPVTGVPQEIREFGLGEPLGVPWLVWLMLACFIIAAFILHATPYGLRVFATGGNREAARLSGIRVARVTVTAFVLSGLFAAVAGIALTARLRVGLPTVGTFYELFAVAAVVLGGSSLYGGRGAMWRTLVGVLIIAMIQNGLNLLNVTTAYQQIVIGAVFILAASSELLRIASRRRLIRRRRVEQTAATATSEAVPGESHDRA
jgi:ribose/xylose/arabinose/galactoside ABC-type transport system permease subunit